MNELTAKQEDFVLEQAREDMELKADLARKNEDGETKFEE